MDLSVTRDPHPRFDSRNERVGYVVDLMISGRFERSVTCHELADDWGMLHNTCERYAAEASQHLKLLGSRDHVMQLVQAHAERWVRESGPDRVSASKLLIETVGGIVQKHEHKVELSNRSDTELLAMCLTELKSDPVLRAKAIAFLTSEEALPMHLLTDGSEVDG